MSYSLVNYQVVREILIRIPNMIDMKQDYPREMKHWPYKIK